MLESCAQIWETVRNKNPLIHCITNIVTVNDVANVLLASGASPAMVEHPEEAADFAAMASGLYLNLGTITPEQVQGILAAAGSAKKNSVPVVVDPVACGVLARRAQLLEEIMSVGRVDVIKGNTAEIKSLAGEESLARGVDSLESSNIDTPAIKLSQSKKCIIAATGKVDTITDGTRLAHIHNETPLFSSITGAGCMVGAVVAACVAVYPEDRWLATVTALCAFAIAGERAAKTSVTGPGSFRAALFDQLFNLRGENLIQEAKIQWQ